MTESELTKLIKASINCQFVNISGDGNHFQAQIVSADFDGKRQVARQQMVYALVQDKIASGELHALSLKTLTPQEAAEQSLI